MAKLVYMVAVDGSDYGVRAAERAVSLAQQTHAEVHLVTVAQWSQFQPLYITEISPPPPEKRDKEEALVREKILDPLEERFADSGVVLKSELFWGHPAEVLHEQAKQKKANMLFVGRRGRSKVANLVLGSVANSLAHKAGVPVVLVP